MFRHLGCRIASLIVLFPVVVSLAADGPPGQGTEWGQALVDRREVVDRHVDVASDGWRWFAEASHGEQAGAPFVLLRLLPELAPDIWGNEEDRFSSFGFFDVPDEMYRSDEASTRPLPLGMGWVLDPVNGDGTPVNDSQEVGVSTRVRHVSITCAACHVGRVQVGPGIYDIMVGAPNGEFDARKYRRAFELTVDRLMAEEALDATVDAIQEQIELKSTKNENTFFGGWYGIDAKKEAEELAIFLDPDRCRLILSDFASKVRLGRFAVEKQLATSYSLPHSPPLDGGTPGQSDGSGDLIPKLLLFREAMPNVYGYTIDASTATLNPVQRFLTLSYPEMPFQLATATDNMSVWRQADRPFGQLDGSVKAPFVRQMAAMTAVVGRPVGVNNANADLTTRFLDRLPPPPYPFGIDLVAARRGEESFKQHCISCHKAGNAEIYGLSTVTTDMNRARVVSSLEGRELLVQSFLAAIDDTYVATDPGGTQYRPSELSEHEVVNDRTRPELQGYSAGTLDGIWSRAPYLHNGSIPTLRHLLAPGNPDSRRPEVFVRGTPEYDTSAVGFRWDVRDAAHLLSTSPSAALFDTRWDGASNMGHDRPEVIVEGRAHRLDWSGPERRRALEDLLEYLKTL